MFPENPTLSRITSHGILALCRNLEKINDAIPRKRLDRRKDEWTEGRTEGQTDGQTLFYRTLPDTVGSPKSSRKI